jgi:hypothetical protein
VEIFLELLEELEQQGTIPYIGAKQGTQTSLHMGPGHVCP